MALIAVKNGFFMSFMTQRAPDLSQVRVMGVGRDILGQGRYLLIALVTLQTMVLRSASLWKESFMTEIAGDPFLAMFIAHKS